MKTIKTHLQLFTILFLCSFVVAGVVFGATFKNVSPQRTEMQIIDDKEVEVNVNTPDIEKTIEKAWTEERTLSFTPQLRISELENMKAGIDGQITNYNKLVDEMTEAKSALNLIIDIPNKLIFK